MSTEYHKINSLFKRDMASPHKPLIVGAWADDTFSYLADNEWEFTEKVDGTNIRVEIDGDDIRFGGRTEAASIPAPLVKRLQDRLLPQMDALVEAFPQGAVLYGEGYGAKIQKGGGNYRPDQDFVLFDVRVGRWWLERDAVNEIAEKFGLDAVPVLRRGTLNDAIAEAREGFHSRWGAFMAEGIVARPVVEMLDRAGHRIITKIKHCDFANAA